MAIVGLELLSKVALFQGLSQDALQKLARLLVAKDYAQDEFVFHRGSAGSALFLIESGAVHISRSGENGKNLVLAMLGPGDFFGELSLLDGEPRSADAVAARNCRLRILSRESFALLLSQFPQASAALIEMLVSRLREADDLIEESAFLDVPGRLARALLELAGTGRYEPRGLPRALRLTQRELADIIGVTRETVSKSLKLFERLGLIRREGRALVIVSPEKLAQRARTGSYRAPV